MVVDGGKHDQRVGGGWGVIEAQSPLMPALPLWSSDAAQNPSKARQWGGISVTQPTTQTSRFCTWLGPKKECQGR